MAADSETTYFNGRTHHLSGVRDFPETLCDNKIVYLLFFFFAAPEAEAFSA